MKHETTKPASFNFLQQQERLDDFMDIYNNDRPHQALNMKYPGELYTPSPVCSDNQRRPIIRFTIVPSGSRTAADCASTDARSA
ncbi:MAG: integrase core domain-containing protein [Pseudomonadales bacterium]